MAFRAYACTYFADENDDDTDAEAWQSSWYAKIETLGVLSYAIAGYEECPTTGRKHLQCYFKFVHQIAVASVRTLLAPNHVEVAQGTAIDNRTYCSKDGVFKEWGRAPRQGKRKDIDELKDAIVQGKTKYQIVEEGEIALTTTLNMYDKLAAVINKGKMTRSFRIMENKFYFGDSGTGKTRDAMAEGGDSVFKADLIDKGWYDGYDGEKTLVIDDFDAEAAKSIGTKWLKNLLDGHPLTLNVKGASAIAMFTKVIITSNHTFRDCFPDTAQADLAALGRRVGECKEYRQTANGGTNVCVVPLI